MGDRLEAAAPELGGDTESYYDEYEEEDEYQDPISWAGLVQIDIWDNRTLKGTVDIHQEGNRYYIFGTLLLPDGKAEFADEFEMIVSF